MIATYIQRGKFKDRDYKIGIDSIITFDYMGSAEFEYGALPNSLKKIRNNLEFYTFNDFKINGKMITVFCNQMQLEKIEKYLDRLSMNNFHLQEPSDFNNYIFDVFYMGTNFWWDIGNNFMFWVQNNEFKLKFLSKIKSH